MSGEHPALWLAQLEDWADTIDNRGLRTVIRTTLTGSETEWQGAPELRATIAKLRSVVVESIEDDTRVHEGSDA